MSSSSVVKRGRIRRAGESAFGLLLVLKNTVMVLLALLLLVAGAWTSWDSARPAMYEGPGERGTLTVGSCDEDRCSGRFTPADGGAPRKGVTIGPSATGGAGERLDVVLPPDSEEAVRTGPAGVLYAWVPFAGALLLASLVVAGGLRMRRTAWVMALSGAALMAGAFVLL